MRGAARHSRLHGTLNGIVILGEREIRKWHESAQAVRDCLDESRADAFLWKNDEICPLSLESGIFLDADCKTEKAGYSKAAFHSKAW